MGEKGGKTQTHNKKAFLAIPPTLDSIQTQFGSYMPKVNHLRKNLTPPLFPIELSREASSIGQGMHDLLAQLGSGGVKALY